MMKALIPFLVAAISVCTVQTGSGTTPPAFTMEQSISDGAQRATLAFAGLAGVKSHGKTLRRIPCRGVQTNVRPIRKRYMNLERKIEPRIHTDEH